MPRGRGGLRVIAGAAKGRRLETPGGDTTRPITDRVKESLFGHLEPRLGGARVLDLYAGSGALGIEALSRGAASAVFVERDREAAAIVEANLDHVGFGAAGSVVRADVAAHVAAPAPGPFDLVFLDPPYALDTDVVEVVLQDLVTGGWVDSGSTVVVRRERRSREPALPERLESTRVKGYGDTVVLVATVR